MKNVMIIVSWW